MNEYITKPFKSEELYEAIGKYTNCHFIQENTSMASYGVMYDSMDDVSIKSLSNSSQSHDDEVDFNCLGEYTDNDEELKCSIISLYIQDFPVYLNKLWESIELRNFEEVKSLAHKMKKPVSIFGMIETKAILTEIEDLAIK
jgi:hypothetical protein